MESVYLRIQAHVSIAFAALDGTVRHTSCMNGNVACLYGEPNVIALIV